MVAAAVQNPAAREVLTRFQAARIAGPYGRRAATIMRL